MRRNLLQEHGRGRKTLNMKVLGWNGHGKETGMGKVVRKFYFSSFYFAFYNLSFVPTFAAIFIVAAIEIFCFWNFRNIDKNIFQIKTFTILKYWVLMHVWIQILWNLLKFNFCPKNRETVSNVIFLNKVSDDSMLYNPQHSLWLQKLLTNLNDH